MPCVPTGPQGPPAPAGCSASLPVRSTGPFGATMPIAPMASGPIGPSGDKKLSVLKMEGLKLPGGGNAVLVVRAAESGPDGLHVSVRDEWGSSHVAKFGDDGWTFYFDAGAPEDAAPAVRLCAAVLRESNPKDRGAPDLSFAADPFWNRFVKDVQDLWPVSDVMLV